MFKFDNRIEELSKKALVEAKCNFEYIDEDNQPTERARKLIEEYQARMDEATKNTKLPDKPDYVGINRMLAEINREVIVKNTRGLNE